MHSIHSHIASYAEDTHKKVDRIQIMLNSLRIHNIFFRRWTVCVCCFGRPVIKVHSGLEKFSRRKRTQKRIPPPLIRIQKLLLMSFMGTNIIFIRSIELCFALPETFLPLDLWRVCVCVWKCWTNTIWRFMPRAATATTTTGQRQQQLQQPRVEAKLTVRKTTTTISQMTYTHTKKTHWKYCTLEWIEMALQRTCWTSSLGWQHWISHLYSPIHFSSISFSSVDAPPFFLPSASTPFN